MAGPDIGPEVKNIPVVDCAKEHTHELYFIAKYESSDVFPGLAELDAYAQRECIREFEGYVGLSVFDSQLTFSWLVPTLNSWNNNDDRTIYCVLGMFDGSTMTGSVKDGDVQIGTTTSAPPTT